MPKVSEIQMEILSGVSGKSASMKERVNNVLFVSDVKLL